MVSLAFKHPDGNILSVCVWMNTQCVAQVNSLTLTDQLSSTNSRLLPTSINRLNKDS